MSTKRAYTRDHRILLLHCVQQVLSKVAIVRISRLISTADRRAADGKEARTGE